MFSVLFSCQSAFILVSTVTFICDFAVSVISGLRCKSLLEIQIVDEPSLCHICAILSSFLVNWITSLNFTPIVVLEILVQYLCILFSGAERYFFPRARGLLSCG